MHDVQQGYKHYERRDLIATKLRDRNQPDCPISPLNQAKFAQNMQKKGTHTNKLLVQCNPPSLLRKVGIISLLGEYSRGSRLVNV
jgi:hypothetical protein